MTAGHPVFAPGTMLGRYELLAPIGEGGMAQVILARARGPAGFEKVVVIKAIHARMAQDPSFIEMLLDEARVAAQIDHPNVVQTYELGEAQGTFYIVMEYLAGESFARMLKTASQHLATHPLDPAIAARVVADAAGGLHAAHELTDRAGQNAGVIHRDISLGNIVVLYNGNAKVVDFGIAKANNRVTSTTQEGQLKGKYAYMSPEQIRNEPMDRRSDVWSLGVVLWEALTLRRLFQTDSVASTLMQIISTDRLPPSVYRPEVGPALDAVTLKALAPDPRDRFQTALEMKRAIEDAIWHTRCGANDVAGYMQMMFGQRIEQRRQLLATAAREQLTAADTQGMRLDEGSGSVLKPPSIVELRKPKAKRRRPLLGGIVLAAGLAVGLGAGVAIVRMSGTSRQEAQAATAPVPPPAAKVEPPVEEAPATGRSTTPPILVVGAPIGAELAAESRFRPERALAQLPRVKAAEKAPERRDVLAIANEQYKKGTELFLAGDFTGAEVAYRAVLSAVPGYAIAHKALGILFQRQGNAARAIDAYRRYLALVPKAPDAESVRERISQLGGE
ncbi:MAG: protein kinase [Deltaproteobacteria bacterium]|nr:protein kinase [Deltaproteobacteria bacterium]